jgi:hypothetical protein
MVFDRLQKLGENKFQKIVNELMRGTPALTLARLIQHEWGDAQDVAEDSLGKQLKRLHIAISNGAFGGDLAQEARQKASVRIKLFHGSSLNTLDKLIDLAMIQEARVHALWNEEKLWNKTIPGLNTIINDYRDLLLNIQKVKFDLGLDEYKFGHSAVKASVLSVTLSDETRLERQLYEAVGVTGQIFRKRGIA